MARRRHIDSVGGYSERFYQWGEEDLDLQWKLSELYYAHSVEGFEDVEVVHLDHPRRWFDSLLWERNRLIGSQRRTSGVFEAIISDLLANESPYAQHLRRRTGFVQRPHPPTPNTQ